MKIKGNMFSFLFGTAMAVIVTVTLLLGGCPGADSGNEDTNTAAIPGAPTIISLTPGDKQVKVAWTAPADNGGAVIIGYSIYYSTNAGDGTNGTKVDAGNATEFVVSGLTNGTEYYFVVTATNTAGEGTVSGESSAIPSATASVPGAPTGLTLTPGNGEVTVVWSAPTNNGGAPITGYNIYYFETQGSDSGGTKVDAGNVTKFTVAGLTNGTTYYFTVTAANSEGESIASDVENAVPATVPDVPTGIILTSGNKQVTVAWTAPAIDGGAAITGYSIYYSETPGNGKNGTKVDAGNVTEFIVSGLTNGSTYYFVVTAVNAVGESTASDEQNAIPVATVPDAPTIVSLTPGDGQVTVAWTEPANDGGEAITGYNIYYSVNSGDGTNGTKVDAGNIAEFVVIGLNNGTEYYFAVVAVNSVGESVASNEASAIPSATATVSGAPTGLKLTPGDGQVTIAWIPPTNNGGATITGYNIYYSETQGSGKNGAKVDVGDVTEYTVSDLTNGTTYYFVVTAVNSVGESVASDEQSAISPTVPDAPTIVSLTPGNQQVSVVWTAPTFNGGADISGYYIYYSENSGDGTNGTRVDAGNVLEYVVGGLSNGVTYYFAVTAVNAKGESAVSSEVSLSVVSVPGPPTDVTARVTGVGVITVSWSPPLSDGGSAITHYLVRWVPAAGGLGQQFRMSDALSNEFVIDYSLTPRTLYNISVLAENANGEGHFSNEVSVMAATLPGSPTGVSARDDSNRGITVSWTPPADNGGAEITYYRVYWDTATGFTPNLSSSQHTTDGTVSELTIQNLNLGMPYYFVVTAVNAAGESSVSDEVSATTVDVPDSPTGVTAMVTGDGEITVSWMAPVIIGGLAITEYRVYWGSNSGFTQETTNSKTLSLPATPLELTIQNLNEGTDYYFVVTAINTKGESDASAEVSATAVTVPDSPTGVNARVSRIGEITVSWIASVDNGGSEITEYRVYWGISTGFTRNLTNSRNTTDVTTREMVFQNMNVKTEYYFVVTASNVAGEGDASAEVSVRAATVPGYPTVVSADLTANGEITVTWSPPIDNGGSPITEYRVYWTSDLTNYIWSIEKQYSKATPDGTTTSLVIRVSDGLIPGNEYAFFVSATNASGEVIIKHVDNQLNHKEATLLTVPDSPTLDSVSLTSTTQQLRVTWTAPENDGGKAITEYTVYWDTNSGFNIASAIGNRIINVLETEALVDGLTIGTTYYFVITASNVRGKSKASNEKSATPAQISSLITALTLTIDSQDYPVTFTGANANVNIDAMATMATVKEVTLVAGASGLAVYDELIISKGMTTIPITVGDGTTREHVFYFRNPQITISATQLKIVDGTKTDGTKKLPSRFMLFDMTTATTVSSQYNVEFLLVKSGETAPTTLEEFRKTFTLHSDDLWNIQEDPVVPMAYKSAMFPTEKTSLYLAHDSEGNYPLDQGTSYTLYAVQPQATDTNPVNLGSFQTGTPADPASYSDTEEFIEWPGTATQNGKFYLTYGQYFAMVGLVGSTLDTSHHNVKSSFVTKDPSAMILSGKASTGKMWFTYTSSTAKPGWMAAAFILPDGFFWTNDSYRDGIFEFIHNWISSSHFVFTLIE